MHDTFGGSCWRTARFGMQRPESHCLLHPGTLDTMLVPAAHAQQAHLFAMMLRNTTHRHVRVSCPRSHSAEGVLQRNDYNPKATVGICP
jgi:hypothetical protein